MDRNAETTSTQKIFMTAILESDCRVGRRKRMLLRRPCKGKRDAGLGRSRKHIWMPQAFEKRLMAVFQSKYRVHRQAMEDIVMSQLIGDMPGSLDSVANRFCEHCYVGHGGSDLSSAYTSSLDIAHAK